MAGKLRDFLGAAREVTRGGLTYYIWLAFLGVFMVAGAWAYWYQLRHGLGVTNMTNNVSWAFYIANFTFLVGVAAAAVLLIIPAYIYDFKPIKEIAFLGEMMAITAIIMCILFVTVDLGHPERTWHLLPFFGSPNFPVSLLAWDIVVLSAYLLINTTIFLYIIYRVYNGKKYEKILPLILLSIPAAVGIHTVTAFLYNGLVARPFWNASILAPRFLASAFCSGPALMIVVLQIVRNRFRIDIENKAIHKIAELIAYTLAFNLFLFGAEFFKEFYSGSKHLAPLEYMYFGLHHKHAIVPFMWTAFAFNMIALGLFLVPRTRNNFVTLNLGCGLIFTAVYIEKGMGLVVPGFIPGMLGQMREYHPGLVEYVVGAGIWATGAFVYTILLKFSIPVYVNRKVFAIIGDTPEPGAPGAPGTPEAPASPAPAPGGTP